MSEKHGWELTQELREGEIGVGLEISAGLLAWCFVYVLVLRSERASDRAG